MWEILISVLIAILAYVYYRWVIITKKTRSFYVQQFKKRGYRVVELPYSPFSTGANELIFADTENKGDAFYTFKRDFTQVDVIVCNMLNKPSLILTHPKLIQEMPKADQRQHITKQQNMNQMFFNLLKRGSVSLEGAQWKHRKKLLSNILTRQYVMSRVGPMVKIIDQIFDLQEEQKMTEENGKKVMTVNIEKLLAKFAAASVVDAFIGIDSLVKSDLAEKIVKTMDMGISLAIDDPLVLLFGEKFVNKKWRKADKEYTQMVQQTDNRLYKIVDQIRKSMKQKNQEDPNRMKSVVELMIEESQKPQEIKTTDKDIIDQVKEVVIAGTDTSSSLSSALFCHVFENPQVLKKLRDQVNSVIKSDQDITTENFKKMNYMDLCILETERIHLSSPSIFQRIVVKDTTMDGVPVYKDTLIDNNLLPATHNEKRFPQPFKFKPERWLTDDKKYEHEQMISFIFGGGPRACTGKNFALLELKVMIIKLLKRYSNMVEHAIQNNGNRRYHLQVAYTIIDPIVTLTKAE